MSLGAGDGVYNGVLRPEGPIAAWPRTLPLAALLALVGGGCIRDPVVDLSVPRREYRPGEYEKVLKRWTRSRRIIKNFDTNLDASVTYLAPEYVTAHAALYAQDYQLNRGERLRYLAKRLAEVGERHELFMAATTSTSSWNDFDRKESVWRITLEDDKGTRVRPLVVTNIKATEVHRIYFPHVTVFHRLYHIIFPRQVGGRPFIDANTRWFKLIIASPLGRTELAWFVQAKARSTPPSPTP